MTNVKVVVVGDNACGQSCYSRFTYLGHNVEVVSAQLWQLTGFLDEFEELNGVVVKLVQRHDNFYHHESQPGWDEDEFVVELVDKADIVRLAHLGAFACWKGIEGRGVFEKKFLTNTSDHQTEYELLRPLTYPETDCFLVMLSLVRKSGPLSVQKWVDKISSHNPGIPFILVGTKCDLRDSLLPAQKKLYDFQSFCVAMGVTTSDTTKPIFLKTRSTKSSSSDTNFMKKLDRSVLSLVFRFLDTNGDKDVEYVKTMRIVTTAEGEDLAQKVGAVKYLECSAPTQVGLKEVFDEAVRAALNKPPIAPDKNAEDEVIQMPDMGTVIEHANATNQSDQGAPPIAQPKKSFFSRMNPFSKK